MVNLGLGAIPFGKGIYCLEVFGVGDAAVAPRIERIIEPVESRQILDNEVRVGSKCIAFVEIT